MIATSREQRRQLARDNAKQPAVLMNVPRDQWPDPLAPQRRVLRSREFLVQEFDAPAPAFVRLSVNRTTLNGERWVDGISWDELQRIKAECGYPMADAVEVYPAQVDEVNVANMRHLWLLREKLSFAWRKGWPCGLTSELRRRQRRDEVGVPQCRGRWLSARTKGSASPVTKPADFQGNL